MKKLLVSIWEDLLIGKNVTVWISLLAALIIFLARLVGWVNDQWTAPFVLALIGLSLYELLRMKSVTEDLKTSTEKLTEELVRTRSALGVTNRAEVLLESPSFDELFSRATSISIITVTCQQVFHDHRMALASHLQAGHQLRILTVNPSPSLKVFDNVVYFGEPGNHSERMQHALKDKIDVLTAEWESYAKASIFSIRLIPHAPPYRLFIIKDKYNSRTAVILPRPLKVTGKQLFSIILRDPDHSAFISYLEVQFDSLWSKAEGISP